MRNTRHDVRNTHTHPPPPPPPPRVCRCAASGTRTRLHTATRELAAPKHRIASARTAPTHDHYVLGTAPLSVARAASVHTGSPTGPTLRGRHTRKTWFRPPRGLPPGTRRQAKVQRQRSTKKARGVRPAAQRAAGKCPKRAPASSTHPEAMGGNAAGVDEKRRE